MQAKVRPKALIIASHTPTARREDHRHRATLNEQSSRAQSEPTETAGDGIHAGDRRTPACAHSYLTQTRSAPRRAKG